MDAVVKVLGSQVLYQVLGTVILLTIIAKFTYKNFVNMLDEREASIKHNISGAQDKFDEASKKLDAINLEEKNMLIKKDEIISEANKLAQQQKNQIVSDAKNEASNIIDKAQNEINANKKNVEQEIMSDVYDYVALVSKNFIADNLDKDKEKELINQAISKVA